MAADAESTATTLSAANGVSNSSNGSSMAPPPPPKGETTTTTSDDLTAEERALYDRQIRLWGAEAQKYIQSANILLVSLKALGTEIAKNLTLAGINSLTIVDHELVSEDDLGAQFFVREEDTGKPRAEAAVPRIQELNPRVKVRADGGLSDLLARDQTYYQKFDCVIACDHDLMTLCQINTVARFAGRPFYAAGIHGFYGYIFADLFQHEFVVEREVSNRPAVPGVESLTRQVLGVTTKKEPNGKNMEFVKKSEIYCPLILANSSPLTQDVLTNRRKLKQVPPLLPCLRAVFEFQRDHQRLPSIQNQQDLAVFTTLATAQVRDLQLPPETLRADFLRSFIQNIGSEITPTAAFVGGRLSEDVINVLGKREQPIQNFALFDGDALEGRIYCLYSIPPELTMAFNPLPPVEGMQGIPLDMSGMPLDMNGMAGMNSMPGMNGMPDMNGMADMNGFAPMPDMSGGDLQTMQAMTMSNGNANPNDNGEASVEAAQQQGVMPPPS